jgi:hypothetical protein
MFSSKHLSSVCSAAFLSNKFALKKEIKQEIMIEVGKETTKMRKEYNEKIVNM